MTTIEAVITFLNARIAATGLISKTYGIAVKGDRVKDKADYIVYIGDGQSKPVTNFDNWNGSTFWIRNGLTAISATDPSRNLKSCSDTFDYSHPFRLIAVVKKNELPCDNYAATDAVAENLIKSLSGVFKASKIGIKAQAISINPKGYTDSFTDLSLPMGTALAVIDFAINYTMSGDCIPDLCDPY